MFGFQMGGPNPIFRASFCVSCTHSLLTESMFCSCLLHFCFSMPLKPLAGPALSETILRQVAREGRNPRPQWGPFVAQEKGLMSQHLVMGTKRASEVKENRLWGQRYGGKRPCVERWGGCGAADEVRERELI